MAEFYLVTISVEGNNESYSMTRRIPIEETTSEEVMLLAVELDESINEMLGE